VEEEEEDQYLNRWTNGLEAEEDEYSSRGRFYRVWRENTWRRVLTAVLAFLLRGQHGIIWGVI
jgi:hypothetical protein